MVAGTEVVAVERRLGHPGLLGTVCARGEEGPGVALSFCGFSS